MRLTLDLLPKLYETLRATLPFRRWKLPPASEIKFGILRTDRLYGDCSVNKGEKPRIRLSARKHERLGSALATMAHEMVHLHVDTGGYRELGDRGAHGRSFKRCARLVLKHHLDFDPGSF